MPFGKTITIPYLPCKFYSKQCCSCLICPISRQQGLLSYSTSLFHLVYIDLWDLYRTYTYNEFRYLLTIVDDKSRMTNTFFLFCKSNAFSVIKVFITMINTQFHTSIKVIRTNNTFELGSASTHT